MEEAKPSVKLSDWPGLATNIDPRDLADGYAQDQFNLMSVQYGEMVSRPGVREVAFDESRDV